MTRRLAMALVACTFALLQAQNAMAGDGDRKARAKTLWKEGIARYNLQRFDQAIDLFERAYEIYPFPNILFNLGQAHRYRKDYEKAIFYYQAYLGEQPGADDREQVRSIIIDLKQLLEAQKSSDEKPPEGFQAPPAPINEIDDTEPANPAPRKLTPPSASGSITPPSMVVSSEAPPWYQDPWAWVLVGSGSGAVGIGAAFLISSSNLEDDADDEPDQLKRNALRERADSRKLTGTLVTIGGAAILGAGIVKLVLTGKPSPPGSVNAVVRPGWIGLEGRF